MKRDLQFVREEGVLGEALGLDPERVQLFDVLINDMIDKNWTLRQCIEAMNQRGDMTDAEWTTMVYALGYFQGIRGIR